MREALRQAWIRKPNRTAHPVDWDAGTIDAETDSFSPYAALAVPAAAPAPYSSTVDASSSPPFGQTATLAASIVGTFVGVAAVAGLGIWRMRSLHRKAPPPSEADKLSNKAELGHAAFKADSDELDEDRRAEESQERFSVDLPGPTRDVVLLQQPPKRARRPAQQQSGAAGALEPQRRDWVSADLGVAYPPSDSEAGGRASDDERLMADSEGRDASGQDARQQGRTRLGAAPPGARSASTEAEDGLGAGRRAGQPRRGQSAASLEQGDYGAEEWAGADGERGDRPSEQRAMAKQYMDRCSLIVC